MENRARGDTSELNRLKLLVSQVNKSSLELIYNLLFCLFSSPLQRLLANHKNKPQIYVNLLSLMRQYDFPADLFHQAAQNITDTT